MHDDDEEHFHLEGVGTAADAVYVTEFVRFCSVGIDIGSSTSHLMFSELLLARQGAYLSSRFVVTERSITAASPIRLTPYRTATVIDTEELGRFIEQAYVQAGLTRDRVDTGAVIITGEAAKKENAGNIIRLFADQAGKFVCASAGPNLEALLAAHGSGAVKLSKSTPVPHILNVDIGGGTSKLALVERGKVIQTAAMNVGARLVCWDEAGVIQRLEEAGRQVAAAVGFALEVGQVMPAEAKQLMAEKLADLLLEAMHGVPDSELAGAMMITAPLQAMAEGPVLFSGGVSEFIYRRTQEDFGDLGPWFGEAVLRRATAPGVGWELFEPEETIRATVIGVAQYTVQVSGDTFFLSDPDPLPLSSVQVLAPRWTGDLSAEKVTAAIASAFQRFDLPEGEQAVALAFHWHHGVKYQSLRTLAEGLIRALPGTLRKELPLVLVFDQDVGRLVGRLLKQELGVTNPIVSIDQIAVGDFDFIDIGAPVEPAGLIPVVVKSLIFR